MALTLDQVRWVSHLAQLQLSEADLSIMTRHLDSIVAYVNQLQQVDTDGVEPLSHALPIHNVFREDEARASLTAASALANAPQRSGDYFAVPAVFE